MNPEDRKRISEKAAASKAAKAQEPTPAAHKKPKRPGPTPDECDKRLEKKGRLPEHSAFDCCWDGKVWRVCLTIDVAGDIQQFHAEGSGLFKTIHQTDDKYRESLENSNERRES